jgi:hypothetical protein
MKRYAPLLNVVTNVQNDGGSAAQRHLGLSHGGLGRGRVRLVLAVRAQFGEERIDRHHQPQYPPRRPRPAAVPV